jgi:hypothetical protein
VVVSRIQHFLVLRAPDRAKGQALWTPLVAPSSASMFSPLFLINHSVAGVLFLNVGTNIVINQKGSL